MAAKSLLSAVARRLEGKVSLITGGASGIGASTAKLFSKHGAKVVIADVQDELGQTILDGIGSNSANYVHCDVIDESQVRDAVDTTIATYGKLDIMFDNAGIIEERKGIIIDNEKVDFERVLSVNLTGVFLGIKHATRVMIRARRGSIISTASVSSVVAGAPHAYTCSKHGVVGRTKNASAELGQFGIRVNCLSPYVVATPLGMSILKVDDAEELVKCGVGHANLKAVTLEAEDVAQAALYLGSDDSRYVSGHNLLIDGGYTVVNPAFGLFLSKLVKTKWPNGS